MSNSDIKILITLIVFAIIVAFIIYVILLNRDYRYKKELLKLEVETLRLMNELNRLKELETRISPIVKQMREKEKTDEVEEKVYRTHYKKKRYYKKYY